MTKSCIRFSLVLLLGVLGSSLSFADQAAFDLPADDQEYGCISQADATRYVRDYNINVNSFGGLELCDNNKDTKKLFNDLSIIENGQFSGKESNMFIRDFVDQNQYYNWMKGQTRGVRRGHDIPYATAYNSFGYFTMQDGWAKLSTLGRVGTIIHEARHTAGYRHRPCTFGPYSDVSIDGCDRTVQEGGSHGIEMEYYSRVVLRGTNFHPAYKAMARMMNLGRSNFVFNENPMQNEDVLLAQSGNSAFVVDEHAAHEHALPEMDGFELKRTSFGASLFNGIDAYAIDIYAGQHGDAKIVDDFSYYKLLNRDGQEVLRDLEEIDLGVKRYVVGLDQRGAAMVYDFGKGDWKRTRLTSVKGRMFSRIAPSGAQGLFIVNQDNSICAFEPRNMTCNSLKEAWPADVKSYVVHAGEILKLSLDGEVSYAFDTKKFNQLTGLAVQSVVSVPVYNAFAL